MTAPTNPNSRRLTSMVESPDMWRDIPVKINESIDGTQLGFLARTIIVSNPTPFWWELPDQGTFVAPFTLNQVIALPTATERARILFNAPPQASQPQVVNQTPEQLGATARFRYIALAWQPQSGVINGSTLQQAVGQTRITLTATSANAPLHTFLSSLPTGFTFWIVGAEADVPFTIVNLRVFLELPDVAADVGDLDSGNYQTVFFSNKFEVRNLAPERVSVRQPIPPFSQLYASGSGFGGTNSTMVLNY